jgi:membrane-anchored protein YejM (alkaline phosphatase superfamily)
MRRQAVPAVCSAIAAVLLCVTLAVFFAWTFPVNQLTENWTVAPENWQMLRAQWEYSHAVNAVLTFLALCSATAAGLVWSP